MGGQAREMAVAVWNQEAQSSPLAAPGAIEKPQTVHPNPSSWWPEHSQQVWEKVQALAAQRAPLVWVSQLQMVRADAASVWLGPQAGQRQVMKFVTQQKNARDQLTELFRQVLGHPVHVEWMTASPLPLSTPATLAPDAQSDRLSGAVGLTPESGHAQPPLPQGLPAGASPATARQAAMRLPLVQQVMDLFDATVVEVRPTNQPRTSEAEDGDTADPTYPRPLADPSPSMSNLAGPRDVPMDHGLEDSPFLDEEEDV